MFLIKNIKLLTINKDVFTFMIALYFILRDIIMPVFIIIIIGFLLQKRMIINVLTLARINIYILVPAFIFVKLYNTTFSATMFSNVVFFLIIYIFFLSIIAKSISKLFRFEKRKKATFINSIIFYNSGNYGVPVNDLVFKGDALAMSIQVIVLTFQNMLVFSYGIFSLYSINSGKLKALIGYFKIPVLYAMVFGIIFNVFEVPIPEFLWTSANYLSDAMIALALMTLGAQVAQLKFKSGLSCLYFSVTIRLFIGPLIALGIIFLLPVNNITGQALFIASSMPTSVNSAVIAQEYNNYPDLAAQVVLFSTIFSAITVSCVIFVSKMIF